MDHDNMKEERRKLGTNCVFGSDKRLVNYTETHIATFEPDSDSDGETAYLYVTAYPSKFYEVVSKGICLRTGSGMLDWAIETCRAISSGMLVSSVIGKEVS